MAGHGQTRQMKNLKAAVWPHPKIPLCPQLGLTPWPKHGGPRYGDKDTQSGGPRIPGRSKKTDISQQASGYHVPAPAPPCQCCAETQKSLAEIKKQTFLQTRLRAAPQPPSIEIGGQGAFYEHPVAKCLFFYIDPVGNMSRGPMDRIRSFFPSQEFSNEGQLRTCLETPWSDLAGFLSF